MRAGDPLFQIADDPFRGAPVERLAVPMLVALDASQALSFYGARQNDGRTIARIGGAPIGLDELADVVTIDGDRLPPEGLPAALERVQVMSVHGFLALSESIDVDGRAEIVEPAE
jgi:hypothetical protein